MFKKVLKYSSLLLIGLVASTGIGEESKIPQSELRAELDLVNPQALKESVTFLNRKYRRKYPQGKQYLSQIDQKMGNLEDLKRQLQTNPKRIFRIKFSDFKAGDTSMKSLTEGTIKGSDRVNHKVTFKGGKVKKGKLTLTAPAELGDEFNPGKDFSFVTVNFETPVLHPIVDFAPSKVSGTWWKWFVEYQTVGNESWQKPSNLTPQWDGMSLLDPVQMTGNVIRLRIMVWSVQKDKDVLSLSSLTVSQQKMASTEVLAQAKEIINFNRKVLLDNPVLDFDKIMIISRETKGNDYGFPWNWQSNSSIRNRDMPSTISRISLRDSDAPLETVFKPENNKIVTDLELDFDIKKMMFSSVDAAGTWHLYETDIEGKNLRQVSPKDDAKDIDSFEGVYLPNGKIIYSSTTGFQGVPCVNGYDYVGNLHLIDADGKNVRRLTFDQDSNWDPVVTNDGRIMYQRWEYTDSAHYFSRVLMNMNPDGTNQRGLYGSNSYWPNTQFNARPVPGSNSKYVAIVSGHHGVKREGEIILFDTSKGGKNTEGVIQRIGGKEKKVSGVYKDNYARDIWPRYVYPYPLSSHYVLASARMNKNQTHHGIYLVDTFGNRLLIKKSNGLSLLEPIPLKKQKRPPVIPSKVRLGEKEGTLYIADIYLGPGLKGVPRGTIKKLRVFEYEYAYRNTGGHYNIGLEGPWDVRNILGTVDVHEDGSAMFKVPANRPLAIQPLDENGRALQQMRSWLTVMPGETLACVGCHEDINAATPVKRNTASSLPPQTIKPWYGAPRGFSFEREVQPVLDRRCIGCHDGSIDGAPNFKADQSKKVGPFSMAYYNLMRYVRRNGPEGDYTLLNPGEFHVSTSRLFQLFEKGHHNVKLTPEEMDRLVTWADINVPYYGTWREATTKLKNNELINRRKEMRLKYGDISTDYEDISSYKKKKVEFIYPEEVDEETPKSVRIKGWPMSSQEVTKLQASRKGIEVELSDSEKIKFASIPAGSFVMGDNYGYNDEKPIKEQIIAKPFYMSTTEITLAQYRAFNPDYSNGWLDMHYKDQVRPGYNMDTDTKFPAMRVTWSEAMEFCKWLSKKIGKKVTLPSEAQWEWAARAGTASQLFYGSVDSDFSAYANLADKQLVKYAVRGIDPKPIKNPNSFFDWELRDNRYDDGAFQLAPVGKYKPNAFGLYDMIGNVSEWTRDDYKPYPYQPTKGITKNNKVVRGGSWYDRPRRARSAYRLGFPQWQRVFNVGFRVIIED